jgi:hypothetical protein
MLSFRLWRAIQRPPTRNPLFRRVYLAPEEPAPWYVGCVRWVGVVIFLPIIALAGLIYGLGWSVSIANLLGREYEQHTFDLARLTPPGPLGMSWAAALGYLYHHSTFRNVNQPGSIFVRTAVSALVLGTVGITADAINGSRDLGAAYLLFSLTMFVALVIDHGQSLVAALLVGILAANATRNSLSAQLVAFTAYSGIQLTTFLVTLAFGFALIPANENFYVSTIPVLLLRLALFAGSRELLIWLLWRRIAVSLGPDPSEQQVLLGLPLRKEHT